MKIRLAIIVSHPIQYYAPLYRALNRHSNIEVKVFFTWHGGDAPVFDQGFQRKIAWDIPLTEGYDSLVVPNLSRDPGTHHFFGLKNPTLLQNVLKWNPDAVHLTGYSGWSHLTVLRALHRRGIPVLFWGDSHLLASEPQVRRIVKRLLLTRIYRWPAICLFAGTHNRAYYETYGVPPERLFHCPHGIDVHRFSGENERFEADAAAWKAELKILPDQTVLLFAGKLEDKKRPVELMRAFLGHAAASNSILIMAGEGHLGAGVRELAGSFPERIRLLPFQNQTRMPVVYRLGDLFVLPSAYGETWGLAINEALACGRPVLVSDKVGCAPDLVLTGKTGEVFSADNWSDFSGRLDLALRFAKAVNRQGLRDFAMTFDIVTTERQLRTALEAALKRQPRKAEL